MKGRDRARESILVGDISKKQRRWQLRGGVLIDNNVDALTCKRKITPASLLQIMECVAHFPLPLASSTAPHSRHRAGKAYPPIAVS
jgi:hypothetical protein